MTIGTDIVHVNRLKTWEFFSYDQLRRIFLREELEACRGSESYNLCSLAASATKELFGQLDRLKSRRRFSTMILRGWHRQLKRLHLLLSNRICRCTLFVVQTTRRSFRHLFVG